MDNPLVMSHSHQDLAIGREVDGYKIQSVLGRGGMGIVYQAEDIALSRPVALKMIDPALARDEAFVRRFRAEARALARVNSPYIVNIHALRKSEFGMLIVMEYVDGGTLADLIDEGPIPWERALPIIRQMLQAFEQAHGVGVIHRDIKPRNIMLSRAGTVKVTDFGLAKVNQGDRASTMTQGVAGTLYYMSPEQVKGLQDLDHRSDLYALGMTIYEMLTGRLPFDRNASDFSIMRTIVEAKLPPPTQFRDDLPEPVARVIMQALEKEPDRRFENAREMLEAFEACDDRQEAAAKKAGTRRRPRRRYAMALTAVLALAVVAVVGGYLIYERWSVTETAQGIVTPFPEDLPIEEAPVDPYLIDDEAIAQHMPDPVTAEQETPADDEGTEDAGPPGNGTSSDTGSPPDGGNDEGGNDDSGDQGTPPPAPATLELHTAEPGVRITARGVTHTAQGTFRLPPGTHTVTFHHPTYGSREERIRVEAGEEKTLTYYFTGLVNIPSPLLANGEERWCTIEVNGEVQDGFTPKTLVLGPGRHTISLRKAGYEILDNGQQVEIRPGFERPEYGLTFGIREQ